MDGAGAPTGEFEELVAIYQAKGLSPQLARLLAATLRRPGERPAPGQLTLSRERRGSGTSARKPPSRPELAG